MRKLSLIIPVIVVLLVIVLSSIFIVDEREKALVLQFGQIKQVREEPGLYFKVPLIQEVVPYDDRILSLDTPAIEVTPSDDRRLVVDAFARYRIADVVRFRQAVGSGGTRAAEDRLSGILNDIIRQVLGSEGVTSNTILSSERSALMNRIRDGADQRGAALGLDVVDVRLKQTNLPEQNLAATFDRMRAEREREATDERARGEEAALRIRAQSDRTVVELVSDARRESEIARGEADARRAGIFAEAYGADPDFFEFYRSMAAYEQALQGKNSTLVISPDSEFFEYLEGSGTGGSVAPLPRSGPAAAEAPAGDGAGDAGTTTAPDAGGQDGTAQDGAAQDATAPVVPGASASALPGDAAPAAAPQDATAPVVPGASASALPGDAASDQAAPAASDSPTPASPPVAPAADSPAAGTSEPAPAPGQ